MKSDKEKLDFLTDKLLAYGPSKKAQEKEAEKTKAKPKKKKAP